MRAERIRSFFCIVGASCRRASIRMRVFDPSVHVLLLCVSSHSTSAASVISGEVPSTAGEALSAARDSRGRIGQETSMSGARLPSRRLSNPRSRRGGLPDTSSPRPAHRRAPLRADRIPTLQPQAHPHPRNLGSARPRRARASPHPLRRRRETRRNPGTSRARDPPRQVRPRAPSPSPPPRVVRPQFPQLYPRADEPNPTRAPRLTLPCTRSPPHLPQRRYRRHLTPREPPRRRRRGTASREPR